MLAKLAPWPTISSLAKYDKQETMAGWCTSAIQIGKQPAKEHQSAEEEQPPRKQHPDKEEFLPLPWPAITLQPPLSLCLPPEVQASQVHNSWHNHTRGVSSKLVISLWAVLRKDYSKTSCSYNGQGCIKSGYPQRFQVWYNVSDANPVYLVCDTTASPQPKLAAIMHALLASVNPSELVIYIQCLCQAQQRSSAHSLCHQPISWNHPKNHCRLLESTSYGSATIYPLRLIWLVPPL